MAYTDELRKPEWLERTQQILKRDHYRCKECGCGKIGYHNGTFISFRDKKEVDDAFGKEFFIGDSFSEMLSNFDKINEYIEDLKDIETFPKVVIGNKYIYDFCLLASLQKDFHRSILTVPTSFRLISDFKTENVNFRMKFLSKPVQGEKETICYGAYMLEFDKQLTNSINVSIENNIKVLIDGVPYYDNITCVTFENKMIYFRNDIYDGLNVHHEFYIDGKKPWEYHDGALITLCEECHKKRHRSLVPIYKDTRCLDIIGVYCKCDKCSGSGYLPQYHHVQGGICFKCGGEGAVDNRYRY